MPNKIINQNTEIIAKLYFITSTVKCDKGFHLNNKREREQDTQPGKPFHLRFNSIPNLIKESTKTKFLSSN